MDAKAQAEARRAKILARQKDRLSSITGTYAGQQQCDEPTQPQAVCAAATEPAAVVQPADATAPALQASQPPQQQQQQQQQQDHGQEQMAALMQMLQQQLEHAQALSQAAAPQQPAAAAAAAAVGSNSSSLGMGGTTPAGQQQQQSTQQQQQEPGQQGGMALSSAGLSLMTLGPLLARSVKQTQLFRLVAALLLAHAALAGWRLLAPPVVVLVASDLAVVLAAAAILPAPAAGAGAGAGAAEDAKVPWRLRSLDVVSLVPGLRELLTSAAGYRAVAQAVSQDFAAYVVALGVLTLLGEVLGWYVPRVGL